MRVSLLRVARIYPACFVPALLAGACWGMLLVIRVAAFVEERPADDFAGPVVAVTLLSLFALLLCRLRAARIEEILATGRPVRARLERYLEYQQWATLWLAWEWQGETVRRKYGLTSGKPVSRLQDRDVVTLVLGDRPRRWPVILETLGLDGAPSPLASPEGSCQEKAPPA